MKRPRIPLLTPEVEGHVAVAVCAAHSTVAVLSVAVAPCFYEIPRDAGDLVEIQVMPAGAFRPRDGRPMKVDAWRIDAALAARVIERFRANKTPLVIDYEHQTLQAEENGQPAPAAGFIRDLEWREGQGLFAKVELTRRAREYVANGEYRYFSPVLTYHDRTGAVQMLLMGALTNNPALDGMAPIELRAAARFTLQEEPAMKNKLLLAICAALAISHENREEAEVEIEAIEALGKLKDNDPLAALRTELSLGEDAGAEEITTAVASLKAQRAATPDPKKFVSVDVVEALKADLAALKGENNARAVDDLVKPALEDGRLLAAQEKWARELGASDIAALRSYLDTAAPIAALRGSQTGGRRPDTKDENGLTADELAVCKATGIAPADYAKNKTAVPA